VGYCYYWARVQSASLGQGSVGSLLHLLLARLFPVFLQRILGGLLEHVIDEPILVCCQVLKLDHKDSFTPVTLLVLQTSALSLTHIDFPFSSV
jgi:hypothetical protein